MSITRINEFHAKSDKGVELQAFLKSIVPAIRESKGCLDVQLVRHHDDPTRFVVIEQWDTLESHKASVKNIPSEDIAKVMMLLAEAPKGQNYDATEGD